MAQLTHISLSKAPFQYSQTEICASLEKIYPKDFKSSFKISDVFQNSLVSERNFILPFEKVLNLGNAVERNQHYATLGLELAQKAAQDCLNEAKIPANEIETVIFVSSTGFAVPSLETYLMQNLGFSPQAQRIPIVGWGCTGGIAGLQLAMKLAKNNPLAKILLINLETCSLAFQRQDVSVKSVIANAIFNDGATASLILGDEVPYPSEKSLHLLESYSHLFPQSSHLMGWEQLPTGLQVILSPEIPQLAKKESLSFLNHLLEKSTLSLADIHLWMLHPGGAKILHALQDALELNSQSMQFSWDNLKENGNMSSCSVIAGLKNILENPEAKGFGFSCAFGPGFACEGLVFSK